MRLKGRQARFVLGSVGGWVAARAALVWGGGATLGLGVIAGVVLVALRPPWPHASAWRAFTAARAGTPVRSVTMEHPDAPSPSVLAQPVWSTPQRAPQLLRFALGRLLWSSPQAMLRRASFAARAEPADAAPPALPPKPAAPRTSRWTGSIYAFVRPGSGRASLAAGGQLGGSQAAARIAYRLNARGPVRIAIALRVYAPLGERGAEAAGGLDWVPLPAVPLRVSIERRVALDRAGRNAWSAYAAGGFYREALDRTLVIDGYAQAGVVGARSHDLFVDGALRAGRRWTIGRAALTLGAGMWGAAQPEVSRLDVGPRLAVTVPVAHHSISAAIEGRLRIAGRANPGSGAALTIGFDL